MRGDEMPEGLSLPDQMAYTAMRNIYWSYHNNIISRDAAAAEKLRIRRTYTAAVEALEFWGKLANQRACLLRYTEAVKTACRKAPTAENALRLCDVIDGLEAPYEAGLHGSDQG